MWSAMYRFSAVVLLAWCCPDENELIDVSESLYSPLAIIMRWDTCRNTRELSITYTKYSHEEISKAFGKENSIC